MAHSTEDTSSAQETPAEHQSSNNDQDNNTLVIDPAFRHFSFFPREIRNLVWDYAAIMNFESLPYIHTMAPEPSASPYAHIVPIPQANKIARSQSRNLRLTNHEAQMEVGNAMKDKAVYRSWPSVIERVDRDRLGNILRIQYDPNAQGTLVNLRDDIFYLGDRRMDPSGFDGQFLHVRRLAVPWRTWFDHVLIRADFAKWLQTFPSLKVLTLIIDLWKITDIHLEPRDLSTSMRFVEIGEHSLFQYPKMMIEIWARMALKAYAPFNSQFVIPKLEVMCLPFAEGVEKPSENHLVGTLGAELIDAYNSWLKGTNMFRHILFTPYR